MIFYCRQGTSVSSVSSIGSYSFTVRERILFVAYFERFLPLQENPGYSTRTRKHRRPQLSESEDGDTSASLQPGGGSLNFGRSSHTLPGRGRGQVMLASDWLIVMTSDWLTVLTSDWLSGRSRSRRYCGEVRQCASSQEPVHSAQARHQGERPRETLK